MQKKLLIFGVTSVLTLFNCGRNNNLVLSKLNISNAASLFLGTAKNSNDSNDTKRLFKITEDGYVEEVTYTWVDEKTGEVKEQKYQNLPQYVLNLSEKYVFVCFNDCPSSPGSTWYANYFVNIETNECYKYPNTSVPYMIYGSSSEDKYIPYLRKNKGAGLPQDGNGNIYIDSRVYSESGGDASEIKRINVQDPLNVNMSNASLVNDKTDYWYGNYAIDNEGNCYYQGKDAGGKTVYRVSRISGGYSPINSGSHNFWQGYDKNVYDFIVETDRSSYPYTYKYYPIQLLSNGESIKASNTPLTTTTTDKTFLLSYSSTKLYLKGLKKIFVVGDPSSYNTCFEEVFDGNKTGDSKFPFKETALSQLDLKSYRLIDVSDNYIYVLGKTNNDTDAIVVFDPSNDSHITHVVYDYDIYNMAIDNNDTITFNATRRSDSACVVATIDASGNVHESSVTFNDKIESLIHL